MFEFCDKMILFFFFFFVFVLMELILPLRKADGRTSCYGFQKLSEGLTRSGLATLTDVVRGPQTGPPTFPGCSMPLHPDTAPLGSSFGCWQDAELRAT